MSKKEFRKAVIQIFSLRAMLYTINLVILGLLIININRGFDITDEGYYLLRFQKEYNPILEIALDTYLYKLIFFWLTPTIIKLRILRIVLTILSSGYFLYQFSNYLKIRKISVNRPVFINLGILTALLSFSFLPYSLSYNSIQQILLFFSIGLLFHYYNTRKVLKPIYSFLLGCCLFLMIMPKLSSIVIIFLLVFFMLLKDGWTRKNFGAFFFILLGFLFMLIPLSTVINPIVLYNDIAEAQKFMPDLYQVKISDFLIIEGQIKKIFVSMSFFGSLFAISILITISFYYIKKKYTKLSLDKFYFLGIITFSFLSIYFDKRYPYTIFFFMIISWFLWELLLVKFKTDDFINRIEFLDLLFLCSIPVFAAFGTSRKLWWNSSFYLPFYWAAFYLILSKNYFNLINRNIIYGFIGVLSLIFFSIYFYKFPYRIDGLMNQDVTIENLKGESIEVDERTADFYNESRQLLISNGFNQNDPILGFYKIPGIIYLLGGTAPSSAIWTHGFHDLIFKRMQRADSTLIQKSWIIIRDSLYQIDHEKLVELNPYFPHEYVLLDTINWNGNNYIFFKREEK